MRPSALLLGAATLITLATGAATPALALERQSHSEGGLSSVPAAAHAAISGVLGRDRLAYRATTTAGGFRSENRSHGLVADFDQGGVVVVAGAGRLGLSLRSLGYGSRLSPVAPARPEATRNRIEYRRASHPVVRERSSRSGTGVLAGRAPCRAELRPADSCAHALGTLRASLEPSTTDLSFALDGREVHFATRG